MKLSIVIPALNEEKSLGWLLWSIKRQNFDQNEIEIIVADAGSKDKTIEIAKSYNCIIVPGGLPAVGRNNGAKVASGEIVLFVDADAILPDSSCLSSSIAEFEERQLHIATYSLLPTEERSRFLFNMFYNYPALVLEDVLPHAAMGIMVKNRFFKELGGFDESITLAEDHDLARRAQKWGKFGILRSSKIYISDRRFRKDGWAKTYLKFLLCEGHMILFGPVKSDIFNYRFDHYSESERK